MGGHNVAAHTGASLSIVDGAPRVPSRIERDVGSWTGVALPWLGWPPSRPIVATCWELGVYRRFRLS